MVTGEAGNTCHHHQGRVPAMLCLQCCPLHLPSLPLCLLWVCFQSISVISTQKGMLVALRWHCPVVCASICRDNGRKSQGAETGRNMWSLGGSSPVEGVGAHPFSLQIASQLSSGFDLRVAQSSRSCLLSNFNYCIIRVALVST